MNPYLLLNIKQSYRPAAPIDYESTKDLISKVSCELQIICALAAVKLVIPKLDKYVFFIKLPNKERKKLDVAIERVERWLIEKGKMTKDETDKISSSIVVPAIGTPTYSVAQAVHSVFLGVYCASNDNYSNQCSITTATAIYYASEYDYNPIIFYQKWWAKCYPLIEKEFKDKYDNLCKGIGREV